MKIIVDGDACPVIKLTEIIAKKYNLEMIVITDVNHYMNLDYAKVITVDQGNDNVDYEVIKHTQINDIIITQDYGLASLVLSKKAKVLHQNGVEYTDMNIESMLFSRYVGQKMKRSSKKTHMKGPKKRTKEDDINFENSLIHLIESHS